MKKNILISGGSGFVGSALIEALSKKKDFEIFAITNNTPKNKLLKSNNLTWIKADLIDTQVSLPPVIHTVFHLAGDSSLGTNQEEIDLLFKRNEILTTNFIQLLKKIEVKHFVYISSIAASEGSKYHNIDEYNGYPVTEYGLSKKRTEEIVKNNLFDHCPVTIFRPTALFGMFHKGSIFELARLIKQGRFVIFGSGDNFTNFYYIDEFIELLASSINNNLMYDKTFIASSEPISLNELCACIREALKIKRPFIKLPLFIGYFIAYIFDLFQKVISRDLPFSSRRLRAMTTNKTYKSKALNSSFRPDQSLTLEGLKLTVEWFEEENLL